ncbi:MAG TPA: hypothetical protein PKH94_10580 [Bacteroidales bacterium]|nr:hypothetical protein [Bacteroidales bacterium]HNS47676.1 hypothetical protein [Bacteroidales bacterium]
MRCSSLRLIFIFLFLAGGVSGQSYFSLTYNTAIPLGNTRDFIPKTSVRGFGVEAGGRVLKDFSVGFSFAWNGFYEELDYDLYGPEDGLPGELNIWCKVWKYTTVYPFLGTVRYYFYEKSDLEAYAALGAGTSLISSVTDFGIYSLVDKNYHLTLSPEAGVIYWLSNHFGLTFNSRFTWSSKAGETKPQSYLGFNLGFVAGSF